MSIQKVFDTIELREYIFSYLFSFEKIIEMDKVNIYHLHINNKLFISLINDYTIDIASEYNSINIIKFLHYNTKFKCTEFAMDIAAFNGNIEILDFLNNNRDEGCSYNALIYAAENNHIDVIKWLHKTNDKVITDFSYRYAINYGIINQNIELIKYLYNIYINKYDNLCCFSSNSISIAITSQNLEIIKWLHTKSNYFSYSELLLSAKYGDMNILEWIYNNRNINNELFIDKINWINNIVFNSEYIKYHISNKNHPLIFAGEAGNLEVVEYICKKQSRDVTLKVIQETVKYATINGFIDIIIFFNDNYKEKNIYSSNIISYAASNGHLNIIKYIYENENVNFNNNNNSNQKIEKINLLSGRLAIDLAALNGHLDIIKWLDYNKNENCSKNALYNACKNGHFDIVKWLIINKKLLFINRRSIDFAAYNGNIEIIRFLYDNNLRFSTKKAMDSAAENGHIECLKYLHKNLDVGCTSNAIDLAAKNGHLNVIKWLHNNNNVGCSNNAMDLAAKNGHLDVIKWLDINRKEGCTTNAIDLAAKNGYIEVVKYLNINRKEGCTTSAIDLAAKNGHLLVIKYLLKERNEGFTSKAIINSFTKGYNTVSKYLFININYQK